jgi:hypothetical protein
LLFVKEGIHSQRQRKILRCECKPEFQSGLAYQSRSERDCYFLRGSNPSMPNAKTLVTAAVLCSVAAASYAHSPEHHAATDHHGAKKTSEAKPSETKHAAKKVHTTSAAKKADTTAARPAAPAAPATPATPAAK